MQNTSPRVIIIPVCIHSCVCVCVWATFVGIELSRVPEKVSVSLRIGSNGSTFAGIRSAMRL